MINIKEQIEWLEDWIQDDPEGLGKDLDTRTFNALEVAMIMQIYKDEQLILSGVSQQSELLLQSYKKGFEAATECLIKANNSIKEMKL